MVNSDFFTESTSVRVMARFSELSAPKPVPSLLLFAIEELAGFLAVIQNIYPA